MDIHSLPLITALDLLLCLDSDCNLFLIYISHHLLYHQLFSHFSKSLLQSISFNSISEWIFETTLYTDTHTRRFFKRFMENIIYGFQSFLHQVKLFFYLFMVT